MSQKTVAQLNAEIDAQITSNGANAITAAVMRPVLKDMADSAGNLEDATAGPQNPTSVALVDGATITWTVNPKQGFQTSHVTITDDRTLAIASAVEGMRGIIAVTQGTGAAWSLTLPGGAIANLSIKEGDVDYLLWTYDGTNHIFTNLNQVPIGFTTSTLTSGNTFVGSGAGTHLQSGGNSNCGIGTDSCLALTTGDRNTAIGASTQKTITTGTDNTAVGYNAKANGAALVGTLALGANCQPASSYALAIGSASVKVGKSDGSGVQTTNGGVGAADALPATPEAYLEITINGTAYLMALWKK